MRTSALLLPALALTCALAACGGPAPDPAPTSAAPLPTETATPTPEPDPSAVAARIEVATTEIQIVAADGSALDSFSVYDPASEVVATLTAAFGTAPTETDDAGGLETAPSHVYDWGGFAIIDYEGETIMNTDFVVDVGAASIGGIQIETLHDLQVGDPMSAAVAVGEGTAFPDYVVVGAVEIDPTTVGESPEWDLEIRIGITGEGGAISRIVTPTPNWGV